MGKNALKSAIGTVTPLWKGSSMPIYEFRCPECDDVVEQFFTVYSDPKINCGHCAVPMKKQFRPIPAIFKGEGWAGKTK